MNRATTTLRTRIGHAEWGDNRFCGHSVAHELAGQESLTGLLALAIGGRRLESIERALLDDIAATLTVGDPRVWPLKLVRVTSSYGGGLAAVAAVNVCFEGARVGQPTIGLAAQMLVGLKERIESTPSDSSRDARLEEECGRLLATGERLFGFGVPFRVRDERLEMLVDCVTARGRTELPYWRLFTRASEIFRRIRNLEPNIGLGAGAVCLDIGFTPAQIGPLTTALGAADFWSNAVEGAAQAPEVLRQIPSEDVRYVGPALRPTPRAARRL